MNLQQIINNIGKPWPEQGGHIGGIMPALEGHPAYVLIVSDESLGFAEALPWGGYAEKYGVTSDWNGKLNTEILVASDLEHPAAEFCANLKVGEFNDFYLPARREASLMEAAVPELFKSGWHWTSSQYSADFAFDQAFAGGFQSYGCKDNKNLARAVRRVSIESA